MGIGLSAEQGDLLDRLVAEGLFSGRQEALDHAVDLLREQAESLADVREGLASIDRGEGRPLREAADNLRLAHGIPEG